MDKTLLTSAIEIEERTFELELAQASRLIEEMRSGRSKRHGAFNLAASASRLAESAGKIDILSAIERSL